MAESISRWDTVVKTFETKWFMMPMATGALGVFSYLVRGQFGGTMMGALGIVFVLLALILFGVMGVIFVIRLVQYTDKIAADTRHPIEVNFLAAVTIAASVASTSVTRVLMPAGLLSDGLGTALAGILYGIGVIFGLVFLWLTVYQLTLSDKVALPHAVGIWLLPPVGLFVSVFAGNFWAQHLGQSTAQAVAVLNLLVFGVALVIYLFVMSLIFQRKKLQPLPPDILAPSFFVPLAPPGVLVIALWSFVFLSKHLEVFAPLSQVLLGVTVLFGAMMIGFGLFWLVYALLIIRRYEKVPFSLGYWAYVFPVNAFGISIALSAHYPLLSPLGFLVPLFWLGGLGAWIYVFYKTSLALKGGKFFQPPQEKQE